jgi:hypothetical protein
MTYWSNSFYHTKSLTYVGCIQVSSMNIHIIYPLIKNNLTYNNLMNIQPDSNWMNQLNILKCEMRVMDQISYLTNCCLNSHSKRTLISRDSSPIIHSPWVKSL